MKHQPAITSGPDVQVAAQADPERYEGSPQLQPSIWIASLLDHEYTIPHGAWISANQPLRGIRADLNEMLAASPVSRQTGAPADRWAIHAHRDFAGYPLNIHEGLERISSIGRGLVRHGPAFAGWATIADEEHFADFDRAFLGHYDDLHSYLEQLVNDLGYEHIIKQAIPAPLVLWVKLDIPATAADLLDGGDLQAVPADGGGVWIFG